MNKKMLSLLMCGALAVGSFGMVASAEEAETEGPSAVTTVGPDGATHFELWSFVDLHNEFYANMVNEWNEQHADEPEKQVQITFSTYPFNEMHNKFMMSLQAGSGAPDICDVEIGKFPAYTGADSPLYVMTDALAPYEESMVTSRLDIYSREDGERLGVPTHVGAAMMYWNAEIFEEYGLDYKSVKTWDDYTALGEQLKEASNGEVYLTSVDTSAVDWLWIAMAEYGEDWTGGPGGEVNVQLDSINKMLTMQQQWLNDGIAMISIDGHTDNDACRVPIAEGKIASFPKASWYMSRFKDYMPDTKGKWDMTPLPVFEEGQPNSVGLGGTGTVVTNECENPELAAEWLAWAKCSPEGSAHIWNDLGFDVCNMSMWTDEEFAFDEANPYNTFFRVKPFEVINQLEFGTVYTTTDSLTINDYFGTTVLNNIFEDGMDVTEALQDAQDTIEMELM